MKIPPPVFRFLEHLLYNHDADREKYLLLREEILLGTDTGSEVQVSGGATSNPTLQRALRLIDSRDLTLLAIRNRAIEDTLRMRQVYREMYDLRYRRGCSWQKVCREMCVSDRTYRRLRHALVEEVGRRLGEI